MAKNISPTKLGAFVLAGLALVALAIAILGGANLFNAKDRCIIYFDGSVKGLYVGSAVTFRGVEVGRVVSISLRYDAQRNVTEVPVMIDLERKRMKGISGAVPDHEAMVETMVNNGLRAQLSPDSLVADTEIVELDFLPKTPKDLRPSDERYPQIPSVPSTLQQLQTEISDAVQHLPKLADTLDATVKALNKVLSPENQRHATAILANIDTISTTIAAHQAQIGDVMTKLDQTSQQLAGVTRNLNQLISEDRAPLAMAIKNINQTTTSLHHVSDQLDGLLAEDRAGIKQFSNGTLNQLGDLVIDTRHMVHRADDTLDKLNRNPSRFIFDQQTQTIPAK